VLRPDIVWKVGGSPVAVVDAKYKAEKPAGYPNADLHQLLAYRMVLDLRTGHLVYAAGSREPARHVVRRSGRDLLPCRLSRSGARLVAGRDGGSRLAHRRDSTWVWRAVRTFSEEKDRRFRKDDKLFR
jgi:hypothetical protein